ncbi:MAG: NB-ARC domain-containing protein [Caldilineaceae bacterium]
MGDEFQSTINGQDKSGVNIGDVDGGIHGSDIAGRDVHVYGDQVQGDKVDRDKVNGDKISDDYIRVTIGDNAQNVIVGKDNQIIINSAGTAPLYVNVPTMPNYFLGREKLITSLTQRLVAQQHLALAMEGLPGVGKTTLAVAIVHRVEVIQHFNDGVLWAGLGQQADINGNLASWAEALGLDISDQNTVGERFQAIKAAIGQRRFLIVIDDAWGIEEAHHLRCGGLNCCHILTTRNQDVAQAFAGREQVISVPVLNDDISYQLLQKLAPKACDADAETAQQLVRVVGGLPLALELLGGFLSPSQHSRYAELGSAALSQMLNPQERLQLAAQRLGSMDNPKVSLQATIMLSLEDPSLPQAAVATFYALGAFAPKPAHFDRSAAEAVAETDLVMLAILASRNLLDDAQGLEQLALHQELANVAITQTPPEAVWRHRSYYLDLVNENPEDWQRIELVYGQIKWARLREVSNSPEDENLLDFIWPLGIYQHRRGLWKDSIDWIKRGVKVAQAKNRQDIIELMFGRLGIVYHDIGQNILAIEQFQQALMIARGIGNRQGESSHLGNLGIAFIMISVMKKPQLRNSARH